MTSPRFVLDTNVLVAALRSTRGASADLLRRLVADRGTLLITVPLFLEYEAVTKRPEQLEACELSRDDVDVVLDVIADSAARVRTSYLWRPQLRDPSDEMVLEAAVNGRADAIVTFNRRDFGAAPRRFGVALEGPRDALRRM